MIKLPASQGFKTDDQRRICEQIEFFMMGKEKQFLTMCSISAHLTSDTGWTGIVTVYNEGYHVQLTGTRSGCVGFLDVNGNVIRKPIGIKPIERFNVQGNYTRIEYIWPDAYYNKFLALMAEREGSSLC